MITNIFNKWHLMLSYYIANMVAFNVLILIIDEVVHYTGFTQGWWWDWEWLGVGAGWIPGNLHRDGLPPARPQAGPRSGGLACDGFGRLCGLWHPEISSGFGPPDPPPPGGGSLTRVVLSAASVTLPTGNIQPFSAYGARSDGSTQAVTVAWTATGGTITAGGSVHCRRHDGRLPGNRDPERGTLADTAAVTIVAPGALPPVPTSCSNQPAGLTVINDQPWNPGSGLNGTNSLGWVESGYDGSRRHDDRDRRHCAEVGEQCLPGQVPAGAPGGAGTFRTDLTFGTNYRTLYLCFWFKTPPFSHNGNVGTKFVWFLATTTGQESSYSSFTPTPR